jgi:uncharacterized membrane protein YphA (DoxX/SURF4 family)
MQLSHLPTRAATGAYILHEGVGKWGGGFDQANGVHQVASSAYPFLKSVKPSTFLRLLSVGEMTTGALLLAPFVPPAVSGAALTGFSGALVTMYLRTPAMHEPGSVWPTHNGIALSKDVWMLGIGLSLIIDGLSDRRSRSRIR